jgi:23S rRNA pseudouridine1911/1915/1917 synthase
MSTIIQESLIIPESLSGFRLDQALAKLLPYSRAQIQEWIKDQSVTLNAEVPKIRTLVIGGEQVVINAHLKSQANWTAQDIKLDIIYEDDALMIINKPPGLVVHPASGNHDGTLLNAILHHCPASASLPRAGILHRLDKDTSGLLVVAKTLRALNHIGLQLKKRSLKRIYHAIVYGVMISGGTVKSSIGRHPMQRKRMAVTDSGKPSVTHYRVVERYRAHTRIKVQLETGRTHQIRVHMAHINYPVLGDPTYGGRLIIPKCATATLVESIRGLKRQALHAYELGLIHPVTLEEMHWRAPLPQDMVNIIQALRDDLATLNPDTNSAYED